VKNKLDKIKKECYNILVMNKELIKRLENAYGVLIYGTLHYVNSDWEDEEGNLNLALVNHDDDGDVYVISREMEENMKVEYKQEFAEWTIVDSEIPPFQILKIDTL
jgi:hypothetical protein